MVNPLVNLTMIQRRMIIKSKLYRTKLVSGSNNIYDKMKIKTLGDT